MVARFATYYRKQSSIDAGAAALIKEQPFAGDGRPFGSRGRSPRSWGIVAPGQSQSSLETNLFMMSKNIPLRLPWRPPTPAKKMLLHFNCVLERKNSSLKPMNFRKHFSSSNFVQRKSTFHKFPIFSDYDDVVISVQQGQITLFCFLWLRWETKYPVIASRKGPIEYHFDSLGNSVNIYENFYSKKNRKGSFFSKYILTTAGRVIFNQQIQQSIQEHFFLLKHKK